MVSHAAIRAARAYHTALRARVVSQSTRFGSYHRLTSVSSPTLWPVLSSCTLHFNHKRHEQRTQPSAISQLNHQGIYAGSFVNSFSHLSSRFPNDNANTPSAAASHITADTALPLHTISLLRANRNSMALSSSSYRRRIYTGRLHSGIEKRRSIKSRSRHFATSSANEKSITQGGQEKAKNDTVTWREALKSPRKSIQYLNQIRLDIFNWAKHMWAGAKLLAADVRVSTKVLKRITLGKQITRRERNFIVQTGVDLARLVPFSLFLIIPLAEFALPFALRLFPHMLPSQFQDQMKSEENLKRRLQARLELAKYLREVVEERAKRVKSSDANADLKRNAEDLTDFLDAIRSGKDVAGTQVSRYAKFFNDELTIDGAARPQLVAMCKYMGLSPYGHDMFLRFKLQSRLNAIKKDDMEIMWEGGVESLMDSEVAKACRDRGIREEVSTSWMRKQLSDWLELSQKREIPGSLLIMSRALLYGRTDGHAEDSEKGLKETLGSMPEDVIMDVKHAADVGDGSTVSRLEETLRQAKLIELESERLARKEKEDEVKRKKREEEEEEKEEAAEKEAKKEASEEEKEDEKPDEETISDKKVMEKVKKMEAEFGRVVMGTDNPDKRAKAKEERELSEEDKIDEEEAQKERDRVHNLLVSLGQLSSDSSVKMEREDLRNLKLQLSEAEDMVKGTGGETTTEMRRLKSLVSKLEREIERVDAKVGLRMKLLDKDNDGVMSMEECKNAMTLIAGERDDEIVAKTLQRLDADADGNISRSDLARLLHEMQFEYGVVEEPPNNNDSQSSDGDSSSSTEGDDEESSSSKNKQQMSN